MGYVEDLDVIDKDDRKKLKKLVGKKLLSVEGNDEKAILIFEDFEVNITAQAKGNCCVGVFWEVHKR